MRQNFSQKIRHNKKKYSWDEQYLNWSSGQPKNRLGKVRKAQKAKHNSQKTHKWPKKKKKQEKF